jgi:hypothetical protein
LGGFLHGVASLKIIFPANSTVGLAVRAQVRGTRRVVKRVLPLPLRRGVALG